VGAGRSIIAQSSTANLPVEREPDGTHLEFVTSEENRSRGARQKEALPDGMGKVE
jgi:hypothetical protein